MITKSREVTARAAFWNRFPCTCGLIEAAQGVEPLNVAIAYCAINMVIDESPINPKTGYTAKAKRTLSKSAVRS